MNSDRTTREDPFGDLAALKLTAVVKGIPPHASPIALGEIGRQGWNLLAGDLVFPVAILRQSALTNNSRWMRSFIESNGLFISPHGKTTMAPQLFRLQMQDGAWGITVATIQQLAVCRQFGFDRMMLANEPIGRAEIDYLFAELGRSPNLDLYCLIDSLTGVERLADAGRRAGTLTRLQVLLEVGVVGGRAGCRTLEQALDVARATKQFGLTLRGIEGFEGILTRVEDVDTFLDFLCEAANACAREQLFARGQPVILSAGGSVFYDRVAARLAKTELGADFRIITRSGCYLTHDSVLYEREYRAMRSRVESGVLPSGDPDAALMVWTHVQSRPEADRAIVAMGRRDVSYDVGMPVPLLWHRSGEHVAPQSIPAGHAVIALNDQHCYVGCPNGSPLAVGDLIGFGISHPCTTFDKWRVLFVVDDRFNIIDAVGTLF